MRKLCGKYHIEGDQIMNSATHEVIPEDEPLFLLRARDWHALDTIIDYKYRCRKGNCCSLHLQGLSLQIGEFALFTAKHSDRMKEPGSSLRREGE